jgi:hypothetical protein
MHMIFNQTEFGHIAIATQWRLRLRRRHGRTCSGHPRLPSLKRRKQGVDGREDGVPAARRGGVSLRGHDGWVSATAIATQWRLRLRFSRRLLYLSKTWQPVPTPEASL